MYNFDFENFDSVSSDPDRLTWEAMMLIKFTACPHDPWKHPGTETPLIMAL